MAVVTVDSFVIVRQFLIASGTDLYALVGDRVGRFRKNPSWTRAQKCIVIEEDGGEPDPDVPVRRPSFSILCYGGSDLVEDAMEVARALSDRLHGVNLETVAAGTIMTALEVYEAAAEFDPDTKEMYARTAYEIEAR